ncbi:hypothetical protein KH017_08600, partial [bacterium]|nr:hypothetical protein [bacterium]
RQGSPVPASSWPLTAWSCAAADLVFLFQPIAAGEISSAVSVFPASCPERLLLKIDDLSEMPIDIFIEMYYNYRKVL